MARPAGFKIVHWTDDQTRQLVLLWRDKDDAELAVMFGRSKKAVKEKRERLGLIRFERAA